MYLCPRLLLGSDNSDEVFSFWSVLRLFLSSDNNEVVFSFWTVPRLLPEEEEVRCYLLSERPQERGIILDTSARIVKGLSCGDSFGVRSEAVTRQ
jgi:hypothetical protein